MAGTNSMFQNIIKLLKECLCTHSYGHELSVINEDFIKSNQILYEQLHTEYEICNTSSSKEVIAKKLNFK